MEIEEKKVLIPKGAMIEVLRDRDITPFPSLISVVKKGAKLRVEKDFCSGDIYVLVNISEEVIKGKKMGISMNFDRNDIRRVYEE